jgi:quinol monooxygenase YgiN
MSARQAAVTVLIEIHAKEGQEKEAREALVHAIQTSPKPGLLTSRAYEDTGIAGAFYAVPEWENADAFHAHMTDVAGDEEEATSMLRQPPKTAVLRRIE